MELELEEISLKYGNKKRYDDSFKVGVHGVIGYNGSGKTTFLRTLSGVIRPNSGRVLFNGEDINIMNERYREMIGYLPQNFGVYRYFTARKFLMYISRLKGLEVNFASKRVEQCLEMVNLTEYAEVKLYKFSGGMKKRIGIAQALLNEPRILILDEPTAGLDIRESINFRNTISELGDSRIVIFSTHILSDLDYITDRVVKL